MWLFIIYLFYLEISPVIASLYSWFNTDNYMYNWAKLCLKITGCRFLILDKKKSHPLALQERNGCIFLSHNEDLFTTVIDTYLTEGHALILSPYSYLSNYFQNNIDIWTTFSKSTYNNLVVYPDENNINHSISITLAWIYQMSIQVIFTKNKTQVFDFNNSDAEYGVELYAYLSEVIRPEFFTTYEEFACYVEMIWEESINEANISVANISVANISVANISVAHIN